MRGRKKNVSLAAMYILDDTGHISSVVEFTDPDYTRRRRAKREKRVVGSPSSPESGSDTGDGCFDSGTGSFEALADDSFFLGTSPSLDGTFWSCSTDMFHADGFEDVFSDFALSFCA